MITIFSLPQLKALSQEKYWRLNDPKIDGLSRNGVHHVNLFVKTWFETSGTVWRLKYGERILEDRLTVEDVRILQTVFPERKAIIQQIDDLDKSLKIVREKFYH